MLTIVWDIDDVLNNLMEAWFREEWLKSHPQSELCYADIRENPPHRVLGIEKREYLDSLDSFRSSTKGCNLPPNPQVIDWLRRYGGNCRHMALTARPLASAPHAAEWLFRHFGVYFRCFGVVPSRLAVSMPLYDGNKADFLKWFGDAGVFVDDSEENIAAVRELGVECVLFPQPWNKSPRTVEETLQLLTHMVLN